MPSKRATRTSAAPNVVEDAIDAEDVAMPEGETELPAEQEEDDEGESEEAELEQDEEDPAFGENAAIEPDYASETTTQSGTDSLTWISWFCSLPGHEYFAEVSEDFIEDDFNLTGLNALVPFYKEALEMVLDVEPEEESLKVPDVSIVESSAELLYGLIHQRFIITRQGLQQMVAKYENAHFGFCPRVFCQTTKVVPCGRSDLPGVDTVKLFCPSCLDTYTPPSSRFNGVDGAFFGTTFPHLLFQTFKELMPTIVAPVSRGTSPAATSTSNDASSAGASPSGQTPSAPQTPTAASSTLAAMGGARIYVPRIYGFKVSERARSGPRMAWLRMRPRQDIETAELDRVDNLGRWREGEGPAGTRSTETAATESGTSTARARAGIVDSPRPSPTLRDADLPAPPKRQRGLAVPTRATSSGPPVQATGSVVIR